MLNNHHIEEYGPLRWKHVSGGTEIYWIPVILKGISVCSNNSPNICFLLCKKLF